MNALLSILAVLSLAACSSGQDMYSKERQGSGKKDQANAEQKQPSGDDKQLTDQANESITVPVPVSGSYLYCIKLPDPSLPANEASAGCVVYKDGQKVQFTPETAPVWGALADPGIEVQFTDLPPSDEYQVNARIKAATAKDLENELPELRITATTPTQYMETNIVLPPSSGEDPPPTPTPNPAPVLPARFTLRGADSEILCFSKADISIGAIKINNTTMMEACLESATIAVITLDQVFSYTAEGKLTLGGACVNGGALVSMLSDCSSSDAKSFEFVGKMIRMKNSNKCLSRSAVITMVDCAEGDVTQEWVVREAR